MKFTAALHAVRIDNEGETRVTLTVPFTDLIKMLELAQLTQQLLEVEVSVNEDQKAHEADEVDA